MHDPELYQEINLPHRRDVPIILEKYIPKLKWRKNNRVIDIGCGDGSVTRLLEKFLPTDFQLLGCDISEEMVKYANKHYANEQSSFTVLDIAGDLPETLYGNFDHVFSFYAINWVIDQKRAFENIFNLLHQDGACVMVIVAQNSVFEVYRALARNSKWSTMVYDVERFISPYHDLKEPEKEVMTLMENIGFVNVEVECKELSYSFDVATARKFFAAINAIEISKDKFEDYMDDYIQVLDEIHSCKDNSNTASKDITFYYNLVIVYGQKPSNAETLK